MARRTIEVDEDVFAFLQQHCEPLVDTPNDVLRRLLLSGDPKEPQEKSAPTIRHLPRRPGALLPLIKAGVLAPGDVLRHEQPRRRMVHEATVTPRGWLKLANGRSFSTPSRALAEQTGTTINGWIYVHVPSGKPLHVLRSQVEHN
ncbi:restriction system modified-DNA reader domain-containing protein [Micromonospora sp. SCSIO 07396]